MATVATDSTSTRREGAVVATFQGFSDLGLPLVRLEKEADAFLVEARSCVSLTLNDCGGSVLVMFLTDRPSEPIIVGKLESLNEALPTNGGSTKPISVRLDGTSMVFSAQNEIVLECGEASITLTRAGKIVIRGAYVSSHSSGVNRIKGGTVEIN